MTKAEQILSKECNRYVNGFCATLSCLKRGGFDTKNLPPPIPSLIEKSYKELVDKSTCEIHEAILEVRTLEEHYHQDNFSL